MNITAKTLADALGIKSTLAQKWAEPLSLAMNRYGIDTPEEVAAFLAQVGHESGRLQYVREMWGPTPAQKRYEGRKDLGNTRPGDGSKYRGRGLIQVTGRAGYVLSRENLRMDRWEHVPDFEAVPEALEDTGWAAASAAEFWDRHNLNELARRGEFDKITRKINGGLNGAEDRRQLWARCKKALGVA